MTCVVSALIFTFSGKVSVLCVSTVYGNEKRFQKCVCNNLVDDIYTHDPFLYKYFILNVKFTLFFELYIRKREATSVSMALATELSRDLGRIE